MKPFQDRVFLITGGGKGIGRETALRFAQLGSKVVICGRTEADLRQTQQTISAQGGDALALVGDVTRREDCQRMVEQTIQHYQRLDGLINNAGMSMRGRFLETDLNVFDQIMAVNFSGAVSMTRYALPYLKIHHGSVVFISSLSGLKGLPLIAPYSSAKMALTALSESLRAEVKADHVHVGIIYVGFTENDAHKTILNGQGQRVPIQRPTHHATQTQVAQAIVHHVRRRRSVSVLTPIGRIAAFFYRFFPRLSSYLIETFAMKSRMYR